MRTYCALIHVAAFLTCIPLVTVSLGSCDHAGEIDAASTASPLESSSPAAISAPDPASFSLKGLRVAISPGHGVVPDSTTEGVWNFQRADRNGIIEDVYTQDLAIDWLYPALERAGATVIPLRRREKNIVGISGQLAWKESSLMYLTSISAEVSGQGYNDATVRPAHAILENADCYISIHLDSSGTGNSRGVHGFVYAEGIADYTPTSSISAGSLQPAGSKAFAEALQAHCLQEARIVEGDWASTPVLTADLGELRILAQHEAGGGASIPAVMIDPGYVDNADDAEGLLDTAMSPALARGILKALVDSFGKADSGYPPERPEGVSVSPASGGLHVSWNAGVDPIDPEASLADLYVVKISIDGSTWIEAAVVEGSLTIADILLSSHGTATVKITALNEAGESLDSALVSSPF